MSVAAIDSDESDDYFMTVTDYLTPTSLLLGDDRQGTGREAQSQPALLQCSKGLDVTQHEAVSKDGTRIPYFQVSTQGPQAGRQRTRRCSMAMAGSRSP